MTFAFTDPHANFSDARIDPDAHIVPENVLSAYGLKTHDVEPLSTGSYNFHFRLDTSKGTFSLRRSNRPSNPDNLIYEASLLAHLQRKGFEIGPEIIPADDGRANVWYQGVGWTLFRWMGDGPKIVRQGSNEARTENAAIVLARLHDVGVDFRPEGARGDWPIFAQPDDWSDRWLPRAESLAKKLRIDDDALLEYAKQVASEMNAIDFSNLPTTVCHADYRPANIRFEGDEVDAVFDFDTAFQTTRLLDLGGAVTRFSSNGTNALADVDSGTRFLRAYDAASPLRPQEWDALPTFIRWRLVRDIVIYYDKWWFTVAETCHDLFNGAADAMVKAACR